MRAFFDERGASGLEFDSSELERLFLRRSLGVLCEAVGLRDRGDHDLDRERDRDRGDLRDDPRPQSPTPRRLLLLLLPLLLLLLRGM